MKGFIAVVVFLAVIFGMFYFALSLERDFMRRCTEAGGSPVPGKTMCLKRDMVVPLN